VKKVIIWTLILVCAAGFAGWYFWLRDGGTDDIENLPPEEVFTPPPPGEEPEGEPYLIDATKHLDPSNLPQSEFIHEWGINLQAVVIAVSDNQITIAPFSGYLAAIEAIGDKEILLTVPADLKIIKYISEEKNQEFELKDLQSGDIIQQVSCWWQKYDGWAPHVGISPYCVIRVTKDACDIQNVDITELERATLPILWRGLAVGDVQDISGRTLTLIRGKETMDILTREDARITMIYAGSDIPWKLDYFKEGDSANIIFFLTEEKELEGVDVGFWRHAP